MLHPPAVRYGSIHEVAAVTEDGQQHKLIVKQVMKATEVAAAAAAGATAQLNQCGAAFTNLHPHPCEAHRIRQAVTVQQAANNCIQ